ncbi:sensor domain-containing phosphodiesterase [Erwinia phyllosphaerae]|uniref:sensor domain-containing phosphodiesterase n=1 Tax=Erwinia phyllosphaerae TaxID=2853256 RepID=UPI001FEE087F|nr:EAL domain-containing protein [Erwinia phyllosphaerae]MBV4367983.1 EAL domain-containing protein [Erwinia phyllosphaerae]
MRITAPLNRFRHSPWGLALILPALLMPLAAQLSVRLWMLEGYVYLIYLPLALMIALLLVYDWSAFPGIVVALIIYYFNRYSPTTAAVISCTWCIALLTGWAGYRLQTKRRWGVDYGKLRLMPVRLFWLAFFIPVLLVLLMQAIAAAGVVPLKGSIFYANPLSLHTLLNLQSVLLTCIAMMPVCYLLIRSLRSQGFLRLIILRTRQQFSPEVGRAEYIIWLCLLVFLLSMLLEVNISQRNLLTTDYGLPLILPLMLWAAMRFGYLFTSFIWALLLMTLYQLRDRFLHPATGPYQLAVISANLLVFSLCLLLMAAITTRQRRILARTKAAALNDPVMNLPNLRALSIALAQSPCSTLFFLTIPDLDRLSRTYGLRLRIQYKRSLAGYLRPVMQPGEDVYQLPGFDLVMRLEGNSQSARVETIAALLKDYHLLWDGLPVHPNVGISYCSVRPPVSYLYELLGELSGMAEQSLTSGLTESLQQNMTLPMQCRIDRKIALLNEIQLALKSDGFALLAEKICGVRGDDYYQVQLSLQDDRGERVSSAQLFPVVTEFGLTWEMDCWRLHKILAFINDQRKVLPGIRMASGLFTASLCRPGLAKEIEGLLQHYGVEPWQLIFCLEESPMLMEQGGGYHAITQLRALGCRIAIDDFGRSYASYALLKEIQADMLKIDGSFVSNMLNNSLDFQIIESTCILARLKKMQIVAADVAAEEADNLLRRLGVDYLQGELYGKPCPLQSLAEEKTAPKDAALITL